MQINNFDFAVIGGGPAGSSTAIHLARAGLNVCLFEKKDFPREVLCGEFLSTEVIASLNKLGFYKEFLSLEPNKINSLRFINEDSSERVTKFQFEAYGMKRSIFDNFLLQKANETGVKIFQPAEVKTIKKPGSSFRLKVLNHQDIFEEISSKYVIAGYGKYNVIDKLLNRGFVNNKSHLNGIKFHINKKFLTTFPDDEIHIYSSGGIYCGINSVSKNEVTVCYLEDRNNYDNSAKKHLMELMYKNKKLADIFSKDFPAAFSNLKVYGAGNIFFGKRELVKDGIFMVGDAAGVIAPLAGDGIGMAMETAELLSKILINGIHNNVKFETLERQYISDWYDHFNLRLFSAGVVQKSILTDGLRKISMGLTKLFPSILPKIVQLTRG